MAVSRFKVKLVISLAKSLALMVIAAGSQPGRARPARQASLHVERGSTAKKRLIATASDASKTGAVDAALIHDAGEQFLRARKLLAEDQSFNFRQSLFNEFLLARLHSEVRHGKSDRFLVRVAIFER